MHLRRIDSRVEILAPAKINLFLEVLFRRTDGYHEIETLVATVSLYDTLVFEPRSDGQITLSCRWAAGLAAWANCAHLEQDQGSQPLGELPVPCDNVVWRAVELLRRRSGCGLGAAIRLIKRIPAAAGLGGGSSDAAAALVAANVAWELQWPREKLAEIAGELGSDVPLFLTGGAAICRGRGERIEPLKPPRFHLALVRPRVGLSTLRVYAACQPAAIPSGAGQLVDALARGDAAAVGRGLANGLQPSAASQTLWIEKLNHAFHEQGVLGHQMSGSGSGYFGLCRHARHARRVASRMRARRMGAAFAATTSAH